MKIKLAILEQDESYLNRIVRVFGAKYVDKLEIYSFTDKEVALSTLEPAKIEVLVASDGFEIDVSKLPKRCGFAYFVDSPEVETFRDRSVICRFQKADLIYKQILSLYSENAGNISGLKYGEDTSKMILFQPVSGGTGASSMAAACAVNFASRGKKTLYLNLERFGAADTFFTADGQFDMSDIIFALKSRKANLALKLESCVKRAENGVFFYSQPKIALDMLELKTEDIHRLVDELQLTGSYDYIIIDTDFSITPDALKLYRKAHSIVWVGDGSEPSNQKLASACKALNILEQNADYPVTGRTVLIYNKFSNKTGQMPTDIGLKVVGGAPRFDRATSRQVLEQLAKNEMFAVLM